MSQAPTEYFVEWENTEKELTLSRETGSLIEDLDPADIFDITDFMHLSDAEAFARDLRQQKKAGHIQIMRRVDIEDNGYWLNGYWISGWEWEEELVNDDI